MADVTVLVPWRPTADREAAWNHLRERWSREYPTWQIVAGDGPRAEWVKADAVTAALAQADGDILVVADADVWCDDTELAVAAIRGGAAWAIPHARVLRLTATATGAVLAGGQWPCGQRASLAQAPYDGQPAGGLVVMARSTYERVPLDPRFVGWGQEDESWSIALHCLLRRPWRGTADLWHLWHEPQDRTDRATGSPDSVALHRRYAECARRPAEMAALIAEYAS